MFFEIWISAHYATLKSIKHFLYPIVHKQYVAWKFLVLIFHATIDISKDYSIQQKIILMLQY